MPSAVYEDVRRLYEPLARAIRRDDTTTLETITAKLRTKMLPSRRVSKLDVSSEVLEGMCKALLGVIAYAYARALSNEINDFSLKRKHVLPVLRCLALQAKEAGDCYSPENGGMTFASISAAIGVKPQNVGYLLNQMREFGLVEIIERGNTKLVTIADKGGDVLEDRLPGWQLIESPSIQRPPTEKLSIYIRSEHKEVSELLSRDIKTKVARVESYWPFPSHRIGPELLQNSRDDAACVQPKRDPLQIRKTLPKYIRRPIDTVERRVYGEA